MSPTRTDPRPEEAPAEPRLTRRVDERIVAGVAAGIAQYFSLSVWLVRAAFVVLAIPLGLGLWLYILAAFAMPPTGVPSPEAPIDRLARRIRGAPGWLWVALFAAGAVLVAAIALPNGERGGNVVAGVVLLAAGVAVLAPRRKRPLHEGTRGPVEASSTSAGTAGPGAAPSPPRRRRERSGLGWMTLGVAIAAVGFAALLDRAEVVAVSPQQYLALPVLILGIGMLVGARWGRAKWLTLPALLLTPPLLLASVIDVPFEGGYADRRVRPQTVADVEREYQLAGGRLTIDLRDVALRGERPMPITAQVAVGSIDVFVPANLALDVHITVDWGYVDLLPWSGSRLWDEYGFALEVARSLAGRKAAGAVTLDLRVGVGSVHVFRGYPESYT